jgi:hypothetical protein
MLTPTMGPVNPDQLRGRHKSVLAPTGPAAGVPAGEAPVDDLLETVTPATLERLPEDLLRRIFARLPRSVQDALHARLFPPGCHVPQKSQNADMAKLPATDPQQTYRG